MSGLTEHSGDKDPTGRAGWPLVVFCVLGALAFHAVFASVSSVVIDGVTYWHTNDDPMITQRVAWNFHETGWPYFNREEAVAANTSLFWPMVLAGLYAFAGHQTAVIWLMVASGAMSVALALVAGRLVSDRRVGALVALAILISPTFLRYGLSGWEHIPQALLVTAALVMVWQSSRREGQLTVSTLAVLLVALAFLVRADSAPTVMVFCLGWLLTDARYRRPGSYLFLAVLAMVPVAYLGLMQYYYDAFSPNTAALKLVDAATRLRLGLTYVTSPLASGIAPLLTLGLLVFAPRRPESLFMLACAVTHFCAVVWFGGDVFTLGRFFLLYLPILIALASETVLERVRGGLSGIARMFPLILIALWMAPYFLSDRVYQTARFGKFANHVEQIRAVRFVATHLSPGDGSIGLHFLGIAYHVPDFHVVDFLGKAEPHIARTAPKTDVIGHNKWDYPYAFSTYEIAAVPIPDPYAMAEQSDRFDFLSEAVRALRARDYRYVAPETMGNSEGGIGLFVRPDLVVRFPEP